MKAAPLTSCRQTIPFAPIPFPRAIVLPMLVLSILLARSGSLPCHVYAQEDMPAEQDTPVEQDTPANQHARAELDSPVGMPVFASPLERLAFRGVDESHFARLIDGGPIDDNERETLMLLMYHYGRFPLIDVERWARPTFDADAVADDLDAGRGQIYRLAGRITRVERQEPLPELIERFELPHFYRCEVLLEGAGSDGADLPAVILARDIPRPWREGGEAKGRTGAPAIFAKFLSDDKDDPRPVFVARRMAHYPDTYLGNLGMDYGRLEEVDYRRPLGDRDREAFYRMLDLTGRTKPGQLTREAEKKFQAADDELKRTDTAGREHYSVVPLFNDAENQRGRLFVLEGTARRIVRIRVEDPDIQERFGIDHYYNLFVFTGDSQSNPIVFCVRELPGGMPIGDGLNFSEHVRVAGFFFKTWAYRVDRTADGTIPSAAGPKSRQLAPLLIGREPVWYPPEPTPTSTVAGAIAAGLFVVAIVGIWFALWHYGRADRRFRKQTIARAIAPEGEVSLGEIVNEKVEKTPEDPS